MSSGFDRGIPRDGAASVKHDGRAAYFGMADVLPQRWSCPAAALIPPAQRARSRS
ncbi:MAG: hypothetical protein WCB93_03400 [Gallionella sp.]